MLDRRKKPHPEKPAAPLRIIAGRFGGRLLHYSGDPRTRPMKQRVREATFNLLGDAVRDKWALDLFAGTGALGFEALSRGASRATFVERHFPTAKLIQANAATLGAQSQSEIVASDVFVWIRQKLAAEFSAGAAGKPWLVFCSPPYDFYVQRGDEMRELIRALSETAPDASLLVVESDRRFDVRQLPSSIEWDVRHYPPAVIAVGSVRRGRVMSDESGGGRR